MDSVLPTAAPSPEEDEETDEDGTEGESSASGAVLGERWFSVPACLVRELLFIWKGFGLRRLSPKAQGCVHLSEVRGLQLEMAAHPPKWAGSHSMSLR